MGLKDITGRVFGNFTVLSFAGVKGTKNKSYWMCRCICGNEVEVSKDSIRSGHKKSCGCLNKDHDITGKQFGTLTAIAKVGAQGGNSVWLCYCNNCGLTKDMQYQNIKRAKSCGCLINNPMEIREGNTYGHSTVVHANEVGAISNFNYVLKCSCGNLRNVTRHHLVAAIRNNWDLKCHKCTYRTKEKHPMYNPNLTEEDRDRRTIGGYTAFTKSVYARDNHTCVRCGKSKTKIHAHHLEGWADNPEIRFDIDNAVTLCAPCHFKFHSVYGKKHNTTQQFLEFTSNVNLEVYGG
jgi:hypothetical protein